MPDDPEPQQSQPDDPFAVPPPAAPTSPPPSSGPAVKLGWRQVLIGGGVLLVGLVLGLGLGRHGSAAPGIQPPGSSSTPADGQPAPPEPPEPAPTSPRDQANAVAAQLWQDLSQAAHLTGVYGEMFWRSATNDERLLVACKYGEPELMEKLIEAGANVNYQDHRTPDHLAVEWEGATPLMLAARRGRLDLVAALLGRGAEVDADDAAGNTALHWAIRAGRQPVALYLVQHGADPNRVTRQTNSTAYGLAFGAGMSDLLVEMEQHGGHF